MTLAWHEPSLQDQAPMPPAALSFLFVAAVASLLFATAGGRLHVVLAILAAAVGYGLFGGMGIAYVARSLGDGLAAGIIGPGLAALTGAVVSLILTRSGGLATLSEGVRRRVPPRALSVTTTAVSVVSGISVSIEGAYALLAAPMAAVARAGGRCARQGNLRLALTLQAGHGLLWPAPGPVIAATVLAADWRLVLFFGVLAAIAAALSAAVFTAVARDLSPARQGDDPPPPGAVDLAQSPRPSLAALPVVVPLALLLVATLGHFASEPLGGGATRALLLAFGAMPSVFIVAIGLAVAIAAGHRHHIVGERGWFAMALAEAAPTVFVVCAAIAFARVVQNSALPDLAGEWLSTVGAKETGSLAPMIVAFAVAAVIRALQGSLLVAMISTAGLVEPLVADASAVTTALVVVAMGAGASALSHANDGYFWIAVRSLGLTPVQGYVLLTIGSTVTALASLSLLFVLSVATA
jgi:GntP family gluconate:H+ symporter